MEQNRYKVQKQLFGQLVIGPPGSGKTTYCHKICEFYKSIGRKVTIINFDPANENMEYTTDIDIMQLIKVEEVMESLSLGPNGALMYCMEFLETNFDWLLKQIKGSTSNYFIFDCPGKQHSIFHINIQINHFVYRTSRVIHTSSVNEKHF